MNADTLIDCPMTKQQGSCYITEVNDKIKTYYSFSSGFWTNSLMKEGEEFYEEQMKNIPELYKELAWKDPETGLVWIPNLVNIEDKGMVFVNGSSKDDWHWTAVKAVKVSEEEKDKYQGKEYRADMSTAKHFHKNDFIEAIDEIKGFEDFK